jgi:hypothetical protein
MRSRNVFIVVFLTWAWAFAQGASHEPPADIQDALGDIRASSLRGDLSFLASDLLEGRDSPSRGLDIAAQYIAAQFRIAGLEPGVAGDYFQNAQMMSVEPSFANFEVKLSWAGREFSVQPRDAVLELDAAVDIKDAPLFKLDLADAELVGKLTASQVEGKVVITEYNPKLVPRLHAAARALRSAKLTILVDPKGVMSSLLPSHRLEDPDEPGTDKPQITLTGDAVARFYVSLKPGLSDASITAHIDAPVRKRVTLRNVIGILRGSDPSLRDTCVMLTAHYDHLGVRRLDAQQGGTGDRIYNGANDDGSGTVSVIAAARALALLKQRPKRSILFMTFFGEEEGLVGSRYYARHPVWPIERTIAQLNLEQLGRTDSTEGRQISNATLTGFDYSDLTSYVQRAAATTGIRIYKHALNSDAYFGDSDNFSLAEAGVPAETLAVAFNFPDYHAVGDEWQKIDYDNMAKVDRAVALAVYLMAASDQPVRWNDANPKTAPYVRASKRLAEQ